MSDIADLYLIDLSLVDKFIKRRNIKKILLQAPDGLKPLLEKIIRHIKTSSPQIEIIVSAEPWYGSCMLSVNEVKILGADGIIHVGHNRYPWLYKDLGIPILYMPAYYLGKPSEELIDRIVETIKYRDIGIVASIQYIPYMNELISSLKLKGYNVYVGNPSNQWMEKGQILGCEYSAALNIQNKVEAFIVVSGGIFHALGLSLILREHKIYGLDPHREEVWEVSIYSDKILKIRYYKLYQLLRKGIRKAALITSPLLGQYRSSIIAYLKDLLEKNNIDYQVFSTTKVDKDRIASIDNAFSPDVFVVTSCPRLPIDDLSEYHKPVITPGELVMLLKKSVDKYIFPW
ncbi:MAG: diphthamide biosynthesis enzyme Dph2 [Crenarchaeota archaeon]|nr:diphthamide biosynthesis enzyme Dph2 [Thermoproteota archaeon]